MEKIEKQGFFKEYKVYDYQKEIHCGIFTGIDVTVSRKIHKYDITPVDVTVHLLVDVDDNAVKRIKTFKNIYHTGRNTFQEFADSFKLFTKDNMNNSIVELNKLLGTFCAVTLNSKSIIESISPAVWADEESEKYSKAFFKDVQVNKDTIVSDKVNSDSGYLITNGNMPYTSIPSHGPYDAEFLNHTDYTGYIKSVECYKDKYKSNDVTICICVYVFNGGYVSIKSKYFNQVKSSGKRQFGKFCNEFDLVKSDGTISPDDITDRFCKIRFDDKVKYIDEIGSDTINGIADRKQYTDLIIQKENAEKVKIMSTEFEYSAKNLRPLRRSDSIIRNINMR